MSFALKPINPKIQRVLEEKSKILSRESAALNIQAGGMSDKLKQMQSRSSWIRWISGEAKPAVILGGVGINDKSTGYSLAKGFKEVYVPPGSKAMQYSPTQSRTAGPHFKPLAGIKSITAAYEGATKSLRKTTITWTVFDLDELEILTPHFLSPGKWSMLEIGWNYEGKMWSSNLLGNLFFDVKEEQDGNPAKPKIDKFEDFGSVDEIIYENGGDYDVFTGMVENFEYSVRDDGGFDCTTTLSTHGISLLDAGKDSTTFTVDTALKNTEVTEDSEKIGRLEQDNINIAMQKLATYFRVKVTYGWNDGVEGGIEPFKLKHTWKISSNEDTDGTAEFYGPKDSTNWFTYAGVKGKTINEGEEDEEFKGLTTAVGKKGFMTEDTPAASWVRWGWFEDNILSKYAGYATMTTNEEGEVTGINDVKLKFRSIDDVLITDPITGALGTKIDIKDNPILDSVTPSKKESVRILSHKKLLTTNVNKFILIGKTKTLDKDAGMYTNLGKFLENAPASLSKYNFAVTGSDINGEEIEEGYIRNIFFNVRWLQEQFEGVGTLREAVDNIWNGFNTEYQNYWQFDVVGSTNDPSIARIIDKNNSRYNVDRFEISTIDLKNNANSRYGCYQFPTWTKDSIVSNMDYSVTIPTSMVAVAALSGGSLDAEKIAQRNRGDINVQTFVKSMNKSFEDSQERFFENITRIAEYSVVPSVRTFGQLKGDENKILAGNEGPDIIGDLVNRDKDLITANVKVKTVNWPKPLEEEETVILKSSHDFFKTPEPGKKSTENDWGTLYKNGAIQSDGKVNYRSTMLGVMHTSPRESKGALTDLLNGIAEIKLTIDGTAGIFPGDAFTSKHLPKHLTKKDRRGKLPLLFQCTTVQQSVTPDGWKTEITGQPRINHNHLYDKSKVKSDEESLVMFLKGEITAGAVTKDGIFTHLFQNRNMLGINQEYLAKREMFVGITKIIEDEYFETMNTVDSNTPLSSFRDGLKTTEDKGEIRWTTSQSQSTGQFSYTIDTPNTHIARCTPAMFPGEQIEKVMRFAMYNGILYSMPDEQSHNSTIPPYTSIDKTFQCVSYNLFKGDKPHLNRWQAGVEIGTASTPPSYTEDYIKKMTEDLTKFPSNHLNRDGEIGVYGIRGFYTPMAILRRGKDIMRKFFRYNGVETEGVFFEKNKLTNHMGKWNNAKLYQELFNFKKQPGGIKVKTGWWDLKLDGNRDIFNLTIKKDSYPIWFDFFKCMFMSYLGEDWNTYCQLIEHPENKGINTVTWKHNEEGLEDSGKIKKLDRDPEERASLINLFTEENMFLGGIDHFSVENEIHKFLQHMIKPGFNLAPEIMWHRSKDISAGNNNTDWWTHIYNNLPKEWDTEYSYTDNNASHEIYPYEDTDAGSKTVVRYNSDGKKIKFD
tara:strand:- start:150 stop:4322 length:4173 start_codon:yes stop_codon:yes gene_type:complete